MSGIRFFSGSRELGKQSIARDILKLEMEKGGKLTSQERFKLIMDKKLKASQKEVGQKNGRKISSKAQMALKEVAAKKAAKQAKIVRQSVIVEKKIFNNGLVQRNGKVFDVAGNIVATINKKNGKMVTNQGAALGQYKPKNGRVNAVLMDAINKHSPYYINLRKMQAMQAAGLDPRTGQPLNQDPINVHSDRNSHAAMHGGGYQAMGSMMFNQQHGISSHEDSNHFPRDQNMFFDGVDGPKSVSSTAWGAMSNNVWGTMGDNVWGTTGDNVWGSQNADIWGGIGFSPWGTKSGNVWGTGSGVNRLKPIMNAIRKLFGTPARSTLKAFQQARKNGAAAGPRGPQGPRGPSNQPRGPSAPVRGPSGPTGRR